MTGKWAWYIAVAILGREFKYQKIMWDDNIITNLISIEKHFWKNYRFDEKLKRKEEVLMLKDKLEKEQKHIEQEIKMYMQDIELAYSDNYRVSWSKPYYIVEHICAFIYRTEAGICADKCVTPYHEKRVI